ncbi:MAG: methylenetetrahydrofolate reductase [Xanthobacteraceae bacterium]|nr:methylenetetrahydrofolate reductase [Xanthobacteraceae bacterium]MCW5675382.1 methylenetetrahydrofolate reductase [Xanthobacteraceae bacterium]
MQRLLIEPSFEIAPGQERDVGALSTKLHPDTKLFVASIAGKPLSAMTDTLEHLGQSGYELVPHIAARNFPSRQSFFDFCGVLGRHNVQNAFVIGGGASQAAGTYHDAEELLRDIGLLADAGIENIGFASYPEGHPSISDAELDEALVRKVQIARENGMKPFVVTQFCFEAEPIIAWERRSRELLVRPVPVVVGMPGVTSIKQLLRYAKVCGVQASAAFLTGHAATMINLLRPWSPHKLVSEIGGAVAEDMDSRIERFHFFPFGALDRTVTWTSNMLLSSDAKSGSENA